MSCQAREEGSEGTLLSSRLPMRPGGTPEHSQAHEACGPTLCPEQSAEEWDRPGWGDREQAQAGERGPDVEPRKGRGNRRGGSGMRGIRQDGERRLRGAGTTQQSYTDSRVPSRSQSPWILSSVQSLWDPMDCSTPGLPVHHQCLEFTYTHVHWVGDAIQPSHPLLSPSPPTFKLFQHQGLFKWVSSSHQVAKVLEFQLQQWIFTIGFLWDGLVGSPCSPRDSQESPSTPQFKSINSSVFSFLYSPTLTSIHDYWKNHNLD